MDGAGINGVGIASASEGNEMKNDNSIKINIVTSKSKTLILVSS